MAWQQTVTAFSGLLATGTAIFLAARAESRSRRDRKEESERKKRAQAARVSAWLKTTVETPSTRRGAASYFPITTVWIVVQNNSDEPVWDVEIITESVRDLGDGETATDGLHIELIGMVPPGGTVQRPVPWTPPADEVPLPVRFRDSANQHWVRDEVGILSELPDKFVY